MGSDTNSQVYLDDASSSILCEAWPDLRGRPLRRDHYENLLKYLKWEFVTLIRSAQSIESSDVQHASVYLGIIKSNIDQPFSTMLAGLSREVQQGQDQPNYDVARLSEFLLRFWLTMEINVSASQSLQEPHGSLGWGETRSLRNVIGDHFSLVGKDRALTEGDLGRLTIKRLIDKHGWTVSWTSNLTEHLMVNSWTKVVKIFEHKICLLHHFEHGQHCPIPKDVVQEALDTLNLLFPPGDKSTQLYLEQQGRPFHLLGSCNRQDYRDLVHFTYWRSQLGQLLKALEEEPSGLKQFVLDRERRNLKDVTTFWLAVVIIFALNLAFGVASTIFAAKGYYVAVMQYDLALAQACSAPGANASLSQYCA